jgi:hypothetical protein
MSLENFSIPVDMNYMNGPCKHSQMILNTPENKRELPCDSCPNMNDCGRNYTECVAMRVWVETGDYQDKDVARLIRLCK